MNLSRLCCTGLLVGAFAARPAVADPPSFESWILNLDGSVTGYSGIPANIRQVRFSSDNVYINCEAIPEFSIGPWPANDATAQDFQLRIPRNPSENTGIKDPVGLGAIGIWTNGVAVFNNLDAFSYNDRDVWHQNAVVAEANDFDSCLGHATVRGVYHHHQNPVCLYAASASEHSPILGFAFDGFPIYGAYGYDSTDGSGGIVRIESSYRQRGITQRTTLPGETPLPMADYGPDVSAQFPLGYYAEDHEFVDGLGHLDVYNGRFAVTPEYRSGTYAYYATIDQNGASAYPYSIADDYYGNLATDNVMTMGHVSIGEVVTTYSPETLTVTLAGTGSGGVTSAPEGISCGSDCTGKYQSGTAVTLTATAAANSSFTGWSVDCAGTASTAVVDVDAAKACTATFASTGSPCSDPNEDNDTRATATASICADFASFPAGTCIDSADTDWFWFTGTAGQILVAGAAVESISSSLQPQLKLYDSMGAELVSATGQNGLNDALLEHNLNGGTYYLSVAGLSGSEGSYQLRALCRTTVAATAFDDVPATHVFHDFIAAFSSAAITSGCSTTPPLFCPDDVVTRAQMAVFIVRALGLTADTSQPQKFTDVPTTHTFYGWIQRFSDLGITTGCGVDLFCPDDSVTREQMAVFIVRALAGAPRTDLGPTFTDVPTGSTFHGWVETFSALEITGGCGGGLFCPTSPVTRGQLAVFIARAFGLIDDTQRIARVRQLLAEGAFTAQVRVLRPVEEQVGQSGARSRRR